MFLTLHVIVSSNMDLDIEHNKYLSLLNMCSRRIWSLLWFSYLLLGNEFINVTSSYRGQFWIFVQSFITVNVLHIDGDGGLVVWHTAGHDCKCIVGGILTLQYICLM